MGRAGLFRIEAKLLAEVLIRVVTLLEVRPPQHHIANNDFLYSIKALDLR
jgi:hypothetical protein